MNNITVIKRDGTEVPYDRNKIIIAVTKAILEEIRRKEGEDQPTVSATVHDAPPSELGLE